MNQRPTQHREKVFRVAVQPGWKAGTRVTFGAAPDFPPVTFVVQEARHRFFTRRGDDLVWRKQLTREQVGGGWMHARRSVRPLSTAIHTNEHLNAMHKRNAQAGKAIVVRVPVLSGGAEVRLPVPAHAVPLSGLLTLREKGHGMPTKKGGGYGDLVVELSVR